MKSALPTKQIPIGKFITQSWRVAIKPPRRTARTPGTRSEKRLLRPGDSQIIVCGFCGNEIRMLVFAAPDSANRGGQR